MTFIEPSEWATAAPNYEPDMKWERISSTKVEALVFEARNKEGWRIEVAVRGNHAVCFARGRAFTKDDAWRQARLISAAMETL